MKINIIKDTKTDSVQPKVYDLGQITTDLQDLLDSSIITITDKQIIVLKVTNIDNSESFYLLPFQDYKGTTIYGFGKNITENDLIILNGSTFSAQDLQSVLEQSPSNGTATVAMSILDSAGFGGVSILPEGKIAMSTNSPGGASITFMTEPSLEGEYEVTWRGLNGTPSLLSDLPQIVNDFPNDVAAAAGGISVGQLYHTAGVVKIRLN